MFDYVILGYMIFLFLNILDFLVTKVILSHPEGKELNPMMRRVINKFGMKGMAYFKVFFLLLIGFQLVVDQLDVFTIYYLNVVYIVAIGFMVRDIKTNGLKLNFLKFNSRFS